MGSVVGLSGSKGTLTDAYSYDAFGNQRAKTGNTSQPYRYLSNAHDSTTGLYDFHARHYDPQHGRFLSKDPIEGVDSLPQTLNPYPHGANNPLRYPDPSGEWPPALDDLLDQIPGPGEALEEIENFVTGEDEEGPAAEPIENPVSPPGGGDTPVNQQADKGDELSEIETELVSDKEEENCAGINDASYHWWGFEIYFDDCQTRKLKTLLGLGTLISGVGSKAAGDADLLERFPFLERFPWISKLSWPLFGVASYYGIELIRVNEADRGRSIIYQSIWPGGSPLLHRYKSQ